MQKEKTIIPLVNFDFGLLPLKPMDKVCNVCMARRNGQGLTAQFCSGSTLPAAVRWKESARFFFPVRSMQFQGPTSMYSDYLGARMGQYGDTTWECVSFHT